MSDFKEYFKFEDPTQIFSDWYLNAQEIEENVSAFTLSTIGLDGAPNSRTLLLKEYQNGHYLFYTNYNSVKGDEIENDPRVSLTFYWHNSGKQVRIQGHASKIEKDKSRAYFQSREKGSQAASRCSRQSKPISSRQELEKNYQNLLSEFEGQEIPYPDNWGGYKVIPTKMTFFIYGDFRLNDRFEFTKEADGTWKCLRLQP